MLDKAVKSVYKNMPATFKRKIHRTIRSERKLYNTQNLMDSTALLSTPITNKELQKKVLKKVSANRRNRKHKLLQSHLLFLPKLTYRQEK